MKLSEMVATLEGGTLMLEDTYIGEKKRIGVLKALFVIRKFHTVIDNDDQIPRYLGRLIRDGELYVDADKRLSFVPKRK